MSSRIDALRSEMRFLEQEILRVGLEEEAEVNRIKEEAEVNRIKEEAEVNRIKEEAEVNRIKEEAEVNRAREEAEKAREAAELAKAVRITEEPRKKSISLIDALESAIDIGEDYIFATACVKRSEDKVAEYDGFATMGAYEAREILEENRAEAVDLQRKFFPSVRNVLVAMRETERERVRYLEKLGLDLETLKKIIGC